MILNICKFIWTNMDSKIHFMLYNNFEWISFSNAHYSKFYNINFFSCSQFQVHGIFHEHLWKQHYKILACCFFFNNISDSDCVYTKATWCTWGVWSWIIGNIVAKTLFCLSNLFFKFWKSNLLRNTFILVSFFHSFVYFRS